MARERLAWDVRLVRSLEREAQQNAMRKSKQEANANQLARLAEIGNVQRLLGETQDGLTALKDVLLESDRVARNVNEKQENQIMACLHEKKQEELREEKIRQLICENSHELHDLESKIKEAYIAKENVAQMTQKAALHFDELLEKSRCGQSLDEDVARRRWEDKKKYEAEATRRRQHRTELDGQMKEKEFEKARAYQEFLHDKMLIDEVVRRIHEEDQKRAEQRLQTKRAQNADIAEFKEQQKRWRIAEEQRLKEENNRIQEYINIQKLRARSAAQNKSEREKRLDKVQTHLAHMLATKEAESTQMEDLRQQLAQEETNLLTAQAAELELESRLRKRVELQNAYQHFIIARAKEKADIKEKEKQSDAQLLATFAENDRLEQLSTEKRRLKAMEHRRELQRLIEEKRNTEERLRCKEKDGLVKQMQDEEIRRKILEEERIRLLKKHAKPLLGYLPKGLIKSEAEFQALDPDVQAELSRCKFSNLGIDCDGKE